jgi:hypothetical protein
MTLPETTEAPHFEATSFRVRGKIFATRIFDSDGYQRAHGDTVTRVNARGLAQNQRWRYLMMSAAVIVAPAASPAA